MNINERVSTAIGLIGKRTAQLAKLEAEILALIDMDARNVSTRDGYPGGSQGPRGNSDLTPTEAGASARMGRRPDDPVHRAVMGGMDALERIVRDMGTVTTLVERVAKLQTVTDEQGSDRWCAHARDLGLPYDEAWTTWRHSTLNGIWSEPRPVSRWVWDYARPRGVLPSLAEMQGYLERKAWAS